MNILTLDLGSNCGFATLQEGIIKSGVINFKPKSRESGGMRFVRFHAWLIEMINMIKPALIIYEQTHHRGGAATEILSTMVGIVQMECAKKGIEYSSIHSATLKKFATGKGRANKEDMISVAREKFNKPDLSSDDEADALHILAWARKEFSD